MELQMAELSQGAEMLLAIVLAYIPNIFAAIAMLIGGWIFAGWVKKAVIASLSRVKGIDPTIRPFLGNILRYAVLAVVLVAVLGQFGIQTASILAVLGAAGLAIGLALQGTLSNIAAGMMLLWLRPFRSGEAIVTNAASGIVQEVGLFTTEILDFNGNYQMVPNSELWNGTVLNYSRMPRRRMDFLVGISYNDSVAEAREIIRQYLTEDDRFLTDPEPQVFLENLGESSLDIRVRVWCATANFWPLTFVVLEDLKNRLEGAGMSIPFPQRDVHLFQAANNGANGAEKAVS